MWPRRGSILFLVPCLWGCSTSGVRYQGVVADPVSEPASIEVASAAFAGPELGAISVSCETPTGRLQDGVSYGDLACSRALLRRAMRETAAFVGGTHLADERCSSGERRVRCSSRVMREQRKPPSGGVAKRSPFDPFAIEVALNAREGVAVRHAPRASAEMVPRVPVSDDVVGEVSASCEGSCDAAILREAIALGARHAGAAHFGPPACQPPVDARAGEPDVAASCTSWVSTHQTDVLPTED